MIIKETPVNKSLYFNNNNNNNNSGNIDDKTKIV